MKARLVATYSRKESSALGVDLADSPGVIGNPPPSVQRDQKGYQVTMLTITVKLDEKRSTTSQFENRTAGVVLEVSNLEIALPEEVLKKSAELFALAQKAVDEQFNGGTKVPAPTPKPAPSDGNGSCGSGNGHAPLGSGHSGSGNGNGKSYGRPQDAPSPKQKAFLAKLAKQNRLGPESIREMAVRL